MLNTPSVTACAVPPPSEREARNYSIAELCHAALVSSYGVGSGGDGTAHHDVVGADLLGGSGSHNALLVAHVAVSKADTGGDGEEVLTAAVVNLAGFQRRADDTVKTCFFGAGKVLQKVTLVLT